MDLERGICVRQAEVIDLHLKGCIGEQKWTITLSENTPQGEFIL